MPFFQRCVSQPVRTMCPIRAACCLIQCSQCNAIRDTNINGADLSPYRAVISAHPLEIVVTTP